ncbi:hypothetical protein [Streptomyces werraensis]|uniref:hypothetical protein n=1 Tax=Streptomyces werraensis TaxID=68284 RepID=UPI0037D71ED4
MWQRDVVAVVLASPTVDPVARRATAGIRSVRHRIGRNSHSTSCRLSALPDEPVPPSSGQLERAARVSERFALRIASSSSDFDMRDLPSTPSRRARP